MEDYFDILGISGREDSYTNLLVAAFNDSETFRRRFCNFFTKDDHSDFELKSRNSFSTNIEGKKNKDIPDLILFNENEIILIEVKIFASEGYRQTERYSSNETVEKIKEILNKPNARFESFFYLTVDKSSARSAKFKNVSWSELLGVVLKNVEFHNDKISVLMQDLQSRVREFDLIEDVGNQSIVEFTSRSKHFVTRKFLFEKYFNSLSETLKKRFGFEVSYANANNVDGDQYLLLFGKPEWVRLRMPSNIASFSDEEQQKFSKTRNVHIEINWTPSRNRISIFVHYETNPYLPEKDLKKLSKYMYEDFYKFKNDFKSVLHKNKPNNWQKASKYLTMIKTSLAINEDLSREKLYDWLLVNVEHANKALDNTFIVVDNM